MKSFLLAVTALFSSTLLYAQHQETEALIRNLEQQERKATLEKDTSALRHLWSAELTVNSPFNRVVMGGRNMFDRPVITRLHYASFERNIEHIMVKGETVISMGKEVVVEKGSNNKPDRKLERRYTNIWQKEDNSWKLIARHANVVCGSQ